jgi:hypothetical protein
VSDEAEVPTAQADAYREKRGGRVIGDWPTRDIIEKVGGGIGVGL